LFDDATAYGWIGTVTFVFVTLTGAMPPNAM
jgi:hypothetical protein